MEFRNVRRIMAELKTDAANMEDISSKLQHRGFSDSAKKLDEDAAILRKMHERMTIALRLDGVELE